jgi:Domain of unknown function (DUF4399)
MHESTANMNSRHLLTIVALPSLAAVPLLCGATPSPPGAMVYIISPTDGATVTNPVTVRFGLKGMGVAPAGVEFENTGHHHLIIDADLPDPSKPIPADAGHLHFSKGQTEATIELKPGKHTLQLVLGDYEHVPHTPPIVSKRIRITVQ